MRTSKIKSITLNARQYTDVNGNTYYTNDILVNGELLHTEPIQYGYGSSYEYSAIVWLRNNIFTTTLDNKIDTSTPWRIIKDMIGAKYTPTMTTTLKKYL